MWDLTVNDDHDFYVLPGGNGRNAAYYLVDKNGVTAVLVHNINGPQCSGQLPLFVLRDGEVASPAQMAASKGGPTAGQSVPGGLRDEMISQAAANGDGTYQCWRCGMITTNPDNVQIGHVNVPRSQGGNLEPVNLCTEGAACNSQNRGAPSPGKSCAERGRVWCRLLEIRLAQVTLLDCRSKWKGKAGLPLTN